jgi:hypothetical protein
MLSNSLLEAVTTSGQIRSGAPSVAQLEDAIYHDLVAQYNTAGNVMVRKLGGEKFALNAAWKQDDLRRQAKAMAKSLQTTVKKQRATINADTTLTTKQKAKAREKLTRSKNKQLQDIVAAEGRMQAETDVLAHSGVVDVNKSRVMNWQILGDNTCPICLAIAAGNPYTVQQATTLGAKAHPNCVDEWDNDWAADKTLMQDTRRKVRDGEVSLWDGGSRTPTRGSARKKADKLQPAKGGWSGRRTQQRRAATQRGVSDISDKDAMRQYARGGDQREDMMIMASERGGPQTEE